MRRGLGTAVVSEADALVAQMNELLGDESWWTAAKMEEASRRFDSRIVSAFYDDLQAGMPDPSRVRDGFIPLPDKTQGYARVLMVGSTGAGKTSLLRALIGSDPDRDRFPSTSTAKTTISDIEVIPSAGPFRAVVTFFSEIAIQTNIEDCVLNACAAVWDQMPVDKVADRLLHHADQRFRLSYVLGSWRTVASDGPSEDDWNFEGEVAAPASALPDEYVAPADAARQQATLESYVARIKQLAEQTAGAVKADLFPEGLTPTPEDREAAVEIFQSEIFRDEAFSELVQDILEEVGRRFDFLTAGDLARRSGGAKWPLSWTYETTEREEFLRHVRWFSSNFAPSFGRLLTPLVDGIRVQGPLYPAFTDRRAKVVLLDGQGLGHTPDSAASVTTHITRRFADVDAILLVDSAEQPIQAAAQGVLRAVASSGHYEKLAIAFTHFDQVKGLNLPGFSEKRAHVLASVHNYLAKLRDVLNASAVAAMERSIDQRAFMLGALQGAPEKLPPGVRVQLGALLDFVESTVQPAALPEVKPKYDPSGLGFAVQRAADSFQKAWAARLGLGISANISAEHHTRIKALNRRIANELDVEYDRLAPVADLVARLSEEISNFLDNPVRWSHAPSSEDEAQQAIAPIRQAVYTALHELALQRITVDHLSDWRLALDYAGKGSAARRAMDIRSIYELAAPIPGTVNTDPALTFLKRVREIVHSAIAAQGGTIAVDA